MPASHYHKKKILFLVKKKSDSAGYSTFESGLHNSCRLTLEALIKHGLVSDGKVVVCMDANSIDREIHQFKPDICSIDAIWTRPEHLQRIQSLHKKVRFVIRVHSNIPFLALEGNAIEWLKGYEGIKNVTVSFNNRKTTNYLNGILDDIYLPNIYEDTFRESENIDGMLQIACMGAIRPLKNQVIQAVAAIRFANSHNFILHFHVNGSRIEQNGEAVLKNMRSLFKNTQHKLVEHKWLTHDEFMKLISRMDCGLQVSYSESFNIVSANFIYAGVPIIVSHDIDWMNSQAMVDCNNVFEIEEKIEEVLKHRSRFLKRAQKALKEYNKESVDVWEDFLKI